MKEYKADKIFDEEIAIYQEAKDFLRQEIITKDELMLKFNDLLNKYYRLTNTARRLCSISDVQGRDLKRREMEIMNLLDNSDQGFLTFSRNLLIDKEHSSECARIFNKKIANLNILELLLSENEEQNRLFADAFARVFDLSDRDTQLSCLANLPTLIKIGENYINIKYKIINTDEFEANSESLMLILTDITEKRKVEDQVLYLSYHDKLTSLFNRAYVESIIPQLQIDSNLPLSIVMADLNALKLVNDVFGHEKGDLLIVNAAQVFLNCCRKSDIIARWGGDEFLIILPGANQDACTRICNKIKASFDTLPADPIELSASLGATTTENWDTDILSLIGVADSVMYSNKFVESKNARKKIVFSVEKVLQAKCSAYVGHSDRVEAMAHKFAQLLEMGQEAQEIAKLSLFARLHDIGKVAMPVELLNKKATLSEDELRIIHKYPQIGCTMAQSIGEPALAQSILAICEQWNGSGYPYGLKGELIPTIARIIAIIEAYDVMTHDQPYKSKMSHEEALIELQRFSGTQFDPNLLSLFLSNINSWTKA